MGIIGNFSGFAFVLHDHTKSWENWEKGMVGENINSKQIQNCHWDENKYRRAVVQKNTEVQNCTICLPVVLQMLLPANCH